MHVSIDNQPIELPENITFNDAFKLSLSGKKFKNVLAGKSDNRIYDLNSLVPADTKTIEPIYTESFEGLELIRHSTAHVMAAAVQKLFPGVKVTIGPAIDNGFYYDFDSERAFTPDDLPLIEAEMKKIIDAALPFVRSEVTSGEARSLFGKMEEAYKLELIDAIGEDSVSLYKSGDFVDLCRGPHLPDTSYVKAFKLTGVAGAYWRGDEKNAMLSRIYGTAFADQKALDKYLNQIEEAKKRDHRRLGPALDLFSFQEEACPGMVYWHPKGALLRTILEDFARKEHLKRSYELVQGPQLLKRELWEKSGHYDNYRENMYFTEIDEQVYGIKPMNCLSHMLIYRSHTRSYRDLPQRYFELGVVHRHEKSGVLHGLLRVRQFTQDDAHIICMPEQLEAEIMDVVRFAADIFSTFGFEYKIAISTRPEKSIGTDEDWERATNALIQAVEKLKLPYKINAGDGAFYGPKIDIRLTDALEREWQCSTVQCDFTLPERFDLSYIGSDGAKHRPVMVHRALLGSLERFIGILIEHYAGAFPVWIAPVQAKILTVTEAHNEFAEQIRKELTSLGLRVEADLRNEKLGFKVREAQLAKIPYILVIGDQEKAAGGVNVRLRNGDNLGFKTPTELNLLIREDAAKPFKNGGMTYSFS
ncbi:threonine--tRNA ligase [Desulfovibrio litoralis]|uniref:Threonine--tRNA ligase n=1 Tax=Desulfovibrio litoralis DSM 11393 TaxID=1121455 RepID=A0A1M7S9R1_9BACT|nr:threonine--tRNA ligase [Desulfovibrio litoralis]SHN55180.1 threonyl-tRNA synthetase [Desulfovibrio litoralis DSM 11393]